MLHNSEICQRFFFGMGIEWVLCLLQFFDPKIENYGSQKNGNGILNTTENSNKGSNSNLNDGNGDLDISVDNNGIAWYQQQCRVGCAVLAVKALSGSLEIINQKHQKLIALKTNVIISLAFWVARRGPLLLVEACLVLLSCILKNNSEVANLICDMMVEVTIAVSGKTHPTGVETPSVYFGYKPFPMDERRFISIPSLLAERYVYCSNAWTGLPATKSHTSSSSLSSSSTSSQIFQNKYDNSSMPSSIPSSLPSTPSTTSSFSLSVECLKVLELYFQADTTNCDMMIQYILAPPPPTGDHDDQGSGSTTPLESIRYVLSKYSLIYLETILIFV